MPNNFVDFVKDQYIVSATATDIHSFPIDILESAHILIKIKFLDSGGAVITPTAGTYDFTVQPDGMDNFETIPDGSVIDATAAVTQKSFNSNASALKYTPIGIAGNDVTNVQITVSSNRS